MSKSGEFGNMRRNRRTLKKRIKRSIFLSAFITVLFISGIFIIMCLGLSMAYAGYQAEKVADTVEKDISSRKAYWTLGVSNLSDIDKEDPRTQEWIDRMNESTIINDIIPYNRDFNYINITIEAGGKVVYSNDTFVDTHIYNFYEDTKAVRLIYEANGTLAGKIIVRVNPELLLGIISIIAVIIIFLSLAALFISKLLSVFLIRHAINPITKLEMKVKAIAEGDQETAVSTEIILKRPLREIESLADSTNRIMKRFSSYNEILEEQKEVLENQNTELEAQNNELIESKQQIQKQQAQLIQSEKMASVGLLTAAITHEINTPIGAINSNVQMEEMLLKQLSEYSLLQRDEDLSSLLNQMVEVNKINLDACSRIIEIIRSLKSFSRLDQAEFQEADINEGIKSVLVLTNNLLKRRITVHEEYGELPLVKCFPGQLNQVILNIIVNASQAIEEAGDIYIRTYEQEGYLNIAIKDTGCGIAKEDIPRVFDPGFTTKGVGIGLGLGLYISYNIIQNHDGEILVESEPGKGAEFIIRIPMVNNRT